MPTSPWLMVYGGSGPPASMPYNDTIHLLSWIIDTRYLDCCLSKGSARKEQLYLGELRASDRDLI